MVEHKNISYRTADGSADYGFTFAWLGPQIGWRVYIVSQPTYGSRSQGAGSTHRLGLGSRPFICWTTKLNTFADARQVAALWADATQVYIATGSFAPRSDRTAPTDLSALSARSESALRASPTNEPASKPRTGDDTNHPRNTLIDRMRERIG